MQGGPRGLGKGTRARAKGSRGKPRAKASTRGKASTRDQTKVGTRGGIATRVVRVITRTAGVE